MALAVGALFSFQALPSTASAQEILKIYWADLVNEKILRSNVDGTDIEDIVTGGSPRAFGLAVDPFDQRIYWIDSIGVTLNRANLDGSFPEVLLNIPGSPHGSVVIDYASNKLYFANGSSSLLRTNSDGSDLEVIVSGLINPRGVALDVARNHLYWTELGSATAGGPSRRIARSTLDGDNVETLVDGLQQPVALALDLRSDKIYWLDDTARLVQRSNLDGSGVETLVSNLFVNRIGGASGIALDLDNDRFFWTHSIGRVLSTTLDGSETTIIVDGLDRFAPGPIALLSDAKPTFTITSRLSGLLFGAPFFEELQVRGGMEPFAWSVESGELPTGMALGSDGTLDGVPTELGQFTFVAQVIDAEGEIATKQFDVTVALVLPPGEVRLSKGCTQAVPGRLQECFIAVENTGVTDIDFVSIVETPMPAGTFAIEEASPQPTLAFQEFLLWELESISPGDVRRLSYEARVFPEVPLGRTVMGQAKLLCSDCIQRCSQLKTRCTGFPEFSTVGNACRATKDECDQCIEEKICQGAQDESEANGPRDPNEKIGLQTRFVKPDAYLHYQIFFENVGDIEAIDVFVDDSIDEKLNPSTLRGVVAEGQYDENTRTLGWALLGRNLEPGETDSVGFSIRLVAGLPSGTEIRNSAEIQFEVFEPLVTPEVVNVIDGIAPVCEVEPLPAVTETLTFPVFGSGTDEVGEIDRYTVFVSEEGDTYRPWLSNTTDITALFSGEDGKGYDFLCVAVDTAGNGEEQDLVAETSTQIVLSPPDGDGDGVLDDQDSCLDSIVTASVVIDGCNSGAPNVVEGDGCTFSDTIAQIAAQARNHGQFVSRVAGYANRWKKAGLITGQQKGAIQSCAAQAAIP